MGEPKFAVGDRVRVRDGHDQLPAYDNAEFVIAKIHYTQHPEIASTEYWYESGSTGVWEHNLDLVESGPDSIDELVEWIHNQNLYDFDACDHTDRYQMCVRQAEAMRRDFIIRSRGGS